MLYLNYPTVRGTIFEAKLPASQYYNRYNLSIGHKKKDGTYENESVLLETPKDVVLVNGQRVEIAVADLAIDFGYNKAEKKQYAPKLRASKVTPLESGNSSAPAAETIVSDDDLPFM